MLDLKVDNLEFQKIRIIDENGEAVTYDLEQELKVNEFNLAQSSLEQPSKYVYWTSILEKLRMYQENYELQAERRKAELYEPSRHIIISEGSAKPTKDQIEARVMLDEEYYNLLQNIVTVKYNVRQVQYIVKAFEQRKDMIIQYGADLRKNFEYSKNVTMPRPDSYGYNQQQM